MEIKLKNRRAIAINILDEIDNYPLDENDKKSMEQFDIIYRALVAMLYNYVTCSGHPGGSISSGRFVQTLIFNNMNYDFNNPDRLDSDIISYAAGHKALGLYAMWALRNEMIQDSKPEMLPKDIKHQLRLEDMLGFRRNPTCDTTLFKKFNVKPLDGHPTPATPFVKLSTGASGVGMSATAGLSLGASDYFETPPFVHAIEGEGGMTPGRVYETLATLSTANISNFILHLDWNQASIDSNNVCKEGDKPGDYVQWEPTELLYLNDWNVIYVPDGKDFQQIYSAQKKALEINNGQPTAIVYKTVKGWKYGIEGRKSHGAGHKFCSEQYYDSLKEFEETFNVKIPCFTGTNTPEEIEQSYWESLEFIRNVIKNSDLANHFSEKILSAQTKLNKLERKPRANAPKLSEVYDNCNYAKTPEELSLENGASITLRAQLGNVLNYLNKKSSGAFIAASADLLGSTSTANINNGFAEGFYSATTNKESRLIAAGGICEDAISGVMSGLSAFGTHIGVGSSYGAFMASLGHIASRLHGIGNQAKQHMNPKEPYKPYFLVCAHAGVKTGEDGPTHADPQPLQLLQENFPKSVMVTLTPWSADEIWPLVAKTLSEKPAIIAPFVTRPNETILCRKTLNLAPASETITGVYALRKSDNANGAVVLQGSGVTYEFLNGALPLLDKEGVNLNIYYVSSAELFDLLPTTEQEKIFPLKDRERAMGISGFTLPTMFRWVLSERGRNASLYPFKAGHYLGSGTAQAVMKEAKLDGENQYKAIMNYMG